MWLTSELKHKCRYVLLIVNLCATHGNIDMGLNTYWPRYFSSVDAQEEGLGRGGLPRGDAPWNHQRKPLSQRSIVHNGTYISTLERTYSSNPPPKKMIYHLKMAAKLPILLRIISILPKMRKNTFHKKFFNEIWLIIGHCEYIYITEIIIQNFSPAGF